MRIVLENRWAYVERASDKELAILRDFYSYFFPAARYARRYKQYLWSKWHAEKEGSKNPVLKGWDGMVCLFKDGRIPAGLFRATRKELEKLATVRVRKVLPDVTFQFQLEATEPEGKYRFQYECVQAMFSATPHGGGIVLSATGSGKTKMAADYFRGVTHTCLFVVDTIGLLHQSAKEIAEWLGEPVGVVGEGDYCVERVTVATSQTLHAHMRDAKFRRWYERIGIVIVDELHEQMGMRNFAVLEKIEPIAVFGLTATLQLGRKPVRFKAWSFAGPIIYAFPIAKATKKKVVTKGSVIQLLFPYDDNFGFSKGREGYLEEYKMEVLEHWEKLRACRRIAKILLAAGRYVLVLADRIDHVDCLANELPKPNRCIRGAVKTAVRNKARRDFERGKVRLLIASKVFKKGISIKRVDAMIDAAEGGSKNDALQKFGRSVRLHKDKTHVVYVDIGTDGGRFGKRAFRRRKAFRQAEIPLKMVKVRTASDAVQAVKKFLAGVNG